MLRVLSLVLVVLSARVSAVQASLCPVPDVVVNTPASVLPSPVWEAPSVVSHGPGLFALGALDSRVLGSYAFSVSRLPSGDVWCPSRIEVVLGFVSDRILLHPALGAAPCMALGVLAHEHAHARINVEASSAARVRLEGLLRRSATGVRGSRDVARDAMTRSFDRLLVDAFSRMRRDADVRHRALDRASRSKAASRARRRDCPGEGPVVAAALASGRSSEVTR